MLVIYLFIYELSQILNGQFFSQLSTWKLLQVSDLTIYISVSSEYTENVHALILSCTLDMGTTHVDINWGFQGHDLQVNKIKY